MKEFGLEQYLYGDEIPFPNVFKFGHLKIGVEYPKGAVKPEFLRKLKEVVYITHEFNGTVNLMRGRAFCPLQENCSIILDDDGVHRNPGMSEIWIPSEGGKILATTSMIYHFIDTHQYLPPEAFVNAIMQLDLAKKRIMQDVYLAMEKKFVFDIPESSRGELSKSDKQVISDVEDVLDFIQGRE